MFFVTIFLQTLQSTVSLPKRVLKAIFLRPNKINNDFQIFYERKKQTNKERETPLIMISNVNAGFSPPNTGQVKTAFNSTVSESVTDKISTNAKQPKSLNITTFQGTLNPQAGWSKLVKSSLEGGSFPNEQPPTSKNALWKQIIAEAMKGSGLSTSKPSAGGDAFANKDFGSLSSSSYDDSEG